MRSGILNLEMDVFSLDALRAHSVSLPLFCSQNLACHPVPPLVRPGHRNGQAMRGTHHAAHLSRLPFPQGKRGLEPEASGLCTICWFLSSSVYSPSVISLLLAALYLPSELAWHQIIGEEESSVHGTAGLSDDPTWMVDPLDGTTNFIHREGGGGHEQVPLCVCVDRAGDQQVVVVAVVFNPILNEARPPAHHATRLSTPSCMPFASQLPHACHSPLNSLMHAIRLSTPSFMPFTAHASPALHTTIGTKRDAATVEGIAARISTLLFQVRSLRMGGSCALNLAGVACGRLDLFYEIDFGGPWDVAAGSLIVEEAGGLCFDP
ncbi:unnamed protein product [Closterium sp. Yama58-4]|nr:unnamed protein product [Closterium sp. Yama58-4]